MTTQYPIHCISENIEENKGNKRWRTMTKLLLEPDFMAYTLRYFAAGGERARLSLNVNRRLLKERLTLIKRECIRATIIQDPFPQR